MASKKKNIRLYWLFKSNLKIWTSLFLPAEDILQNSSNTDQTTWNSTLSALLAKQLIYSICSASNKKK